MINVEIEDLQGDVELVLDNCSTGTPSFKDIDIKFLNEDEDNITEDTMLLITDRETQCTMKLTIKELYDVTGVSMDKTSSLINKQQI